MGLSACYNISLSDHRNGEEERIRVVVAPRERGRARFHANNLTKEPSSNPCRRPEPDMGNHHAAEDDYEEAAQFLNHFHAIASRSLDVIYEMNDIDDTEGCDEDEYYFKVNHHPFGSSSLGGGLPGIRRTKTCACLLEAQHAQALNAKVEESQDEEWGYYCEERN